MKVKIVAWSEEYYYDFLEIKKEEKVIYSGEYIALLSTDDKNFRLNLNYGIREKSSSIILKKFCDSFYSFLLVKIHFYFLFNEPWKRKCPAISKKHLFILLIH